MVSDLIVRQQAELHTTRVYTHKQACLQIVWMSCHVAAMKPNHCHVMYFFKYKSSLGFNALYAYRHLCHANTYAFERNYWIIFYRVNVAIILELYMESMLRHVFACDVMQSLSLIICLIDLCTAKRTGPSSNHQICNMLYYPHNLNE